MSPDQREGVFDAWVGGRWSEGMGRAATCRANDRAENGLVPARSRGTKPADGILAIRLK